VRSAGYCDSQAWDGRLRQRIVARISAQQPVVIIFIFGGNRVQKSCKSASDLAGGALAASTLQQALAGGVLVAWGNLEQRELILVAVA